MWDEIFGKEPDRPIDWADAKQVQEAVASAHQQFNAAYQAGGAAQQATIYNYNMHSLQGAGGPATSQQPWQQLNAQATQQLRQQANSWSPTDWVWNGTPCTIEEFAEAAYGDTPERTHFLLKYKGIDE